MKSRSAIPCQSSTSPSIWPDWNSRRIPRTLSVSTFLLNISPNLSHILQSPWCAIGNSEWTRSRNSEHLWTRDWGRSRVCRPRFSSIKTRSMLFFFLGPILSRLIPQHTIDKQVFPSLEFIGWYTVAPKPTARHIALHDQVRSLFALITRRHNNASNSSRDIVRLCCCWSCNPPWQWSQLLMSMHRPFLLRLSSPQSRLGIANRVQFTLKFLTMSKLGKPSA